MDPLTLRYNNPGAVEFKPWMQQYGATIGPNGRYAQFDTPDNGYRVMGRILDTYESKHGLNTVSGIINRWAPSTVDNNSTAGYISSVARQVGVDPNQPLTAQHRQSLMQAMANYEAGRNAAPVSGGGAPVQPPGPGPAIGGQAEGGAMQDGNGFSLMGLLSGLSNGMQSPLFRSGAAMYDAGSRGINPGGAFLAGSEASTQASRDQLVQANMQRQMGQQQLRDKLWSDLTSGKTPPWASELPAGTIQLAAALGPDAGSQLITQLMMKAGDNDIARQRLQLDRDAGVRAAAADARTAEMHPEQLRALKAQTDRGAERTPVELDLLRAQAEQARKKDELSEFVVGAMRQAMPDAVPARPAPSAPSAPNPPPPRLIPQSSPIDPDAPRLQQTQAVEQSDDDEMRNAAAGVGKEPTVMVFGKPMPLSRASAFGQALMMNPQTGKLGEQIMKSVTDVSSLGETARNKLQDQQLGAIDNLERFRRVAKLYRPEFQTIESQLAIMGASLADRSDTLRRMLSPEQLQLVQDYSRYRQAAAETTNWYIKIVTGAQMSEAEAKRLMKAVPDIENDSPSQFEGKLLEGIRQQRLALYRYNYLTKTGVTDLAQNLKQADESGRLPDGRMIPTLDGMETQMRRRRDELRAIYQGRMPNADLQRIDAEVRRQMRQEYGA